jgi:phenylpyruvate tautomerase PptA (4-oxalocrotonate tautomerase family)
MHSLPRKELTEEQRAKLVESVTSIHQLEATAPRYFVQVIFYKVEPGSMFIGGEPASTDHIWVRADIRSGRRRCLRYVQRCCVGYGLGPGRSIAQAGQALSVPLAIRIR